MKGIRINERVCCFFEKVVGENGWDGRGDLFLMLGVRYLRVDSVGVVLVFNCRGGKIDSVSVRFGNVVRCMIVLFYVLNYYDYVWFIL